MDLPDRRQWLKATAGGAIALGGGAILAQDRGRGAPWELNAAEYIEYGRSFICNEYTDQNRPAADPNNKPMFLIESRTQIIRAGATATYYQCASCKAEDTYPPQDLFRVPNYDFLPVFGPDNVLVFRRGSRLNAPPQEYKRVEGHNWGVPMPALRKAESVRVLDSARKVFEATRPSVALPIVARTYVRSDDGYEAVVEYPVKTMNATSDGGYKYQVDTGPIVWPNLWRGEDRGGIASLSLAFIAFNHHTDSTYVEVIEERQIEVSLPDDPNRKLAVYHYEPVSGNYRFAARTTLVALKV